MIQIYPVNISRNCIKIIQTLKPADVILPQARFKSITISPAKLFLVKGNYFKKIQTGFYYKKLLAVNSGMIISKSFLTATKFMYEEKLLSYGTENYFMNFANKHNAVFYIMNFQFKHGYSFYEITDNNKRIEIFRQIKQANKLAFSFNVFQSICINIYNFVASVKNTLKYKSIKFLIKKS